MNSKEKSIRSRIYLFSFLQVLVPGLIFSIPTYLISFLRAGLAAKYTQYIAYGIFLVFLVGALLRLTVVYVMNVLQDNRDEKCK